ncbi:MAG: NUDIX hydrolase, partial [Planctomycetota bacterium]
MPRLDTADDRLLYCGEFLQLRAKGTWEYAHRPNATAIVAVFAVHHGHLICVEQERPPVGKSVLEVPAGL